jgi:hypothetical protein
MINRSNHISSCTFIVFTLISKNTHAYINHIEAILQDQTICISYKKVSIGIFFFSMASGSIEGTRNDYRNHCHRCRNTFPTKKSFENHMKTTTSVLHVWEFTWQKLKEMSMWRMEDAARNKFSVWYMQVYIFSMFVLLECCYCW